MESSKSGHEWLFHFLLYHKIEHRVGKCIVAVARNHVAGLRHVALPLVGTPAPLGAGVAGAADPLDVVGSLARAAWAHPALLLEAAAFALVAAALPLARSYGRWGAAGLGAGMLVLTVAVVPSATAWPLVAAAWVTAGAAAVALER